MLSQRLLTLSPRSLLCVPDYPQCTELRCANGACYNRTQRCNQVAECRDGSDEANCSKRTQRIPLPQTLPQAPKAGLLSATMFPIVWCIFGGMMVPSVLLSSCPLSLCSAALQYRTVCLSQRRVRAAEIRLRPRRRLWGQE